MATLERWSLVGGRIKCIHNSSGKIFGDITLLTVTTKRGSTVQYSSPSLIRAPYMPRNCGHIREVAFGEREK